MQSLPNPHNPIPPAAPDLPAPAIDATPSAAIPQSIPVPSSATPAYSIPLRKCLLALAACWATGGLLRFLAVCFESTPLSRASSILLFAPLPVISLWLAWRTRLRPPEIVFSGLLAVAAFAVWNGIMLFELPTPALAYALQQNALHWLLFAILAIVAGKCWQWLTGVGIWRRTSNNETIAEPLPSRLSLRHLLAITAAIAISIVAYQSWIRSVLASQPSIAIVQSDMDQVLMPEPPTWYQWFPENSRLWVSGAVGGFLLPLHAFVLAAILRMRQHRGIAIVAWIVAATGIRLLSEQIYWDNDRLNLSGSDLTWIQVSYSNSLPGRIGIPRRYASYIEPFDHPGQSDPNTTSQPAPWSLASMFEAGGLAEKLPSKALDACIQTAVLAASLVWLAIHGYRIGARTIRPNLDAPGSAHTATSLEGRKPREAIR
ncbi:MAG: hypothetical protein ACK5OB_07360 [Pirellula sp.]